MVGIETAWVGPYDDEPDCRYNCGVGCDTQDQCDHCGWNPEVARQRLNDVK